MNAPVDPWKLKRAGLIYPQPIALAAGRILQARTVQARVDAALKAAEILTRYLAAAALASSAARTEGDSPKFHDFKGALAFGSFLNVAQAVAKQSNHPLAPYMVPLRKTKKRSIGKAEEPLIELLKLRNELGHDLSALNDAKAKTIAKERSPVKAFFEATDALEGLLSLPLFVFDGIEWNHDRDHLVGRRLMLMGASTTPIPEEVGLERGLPTKTPMIAVGDDALVLPPWVVWEVDGQDYRLFFVDRIRNKRVEYKTIGPGGFDDEKNVSTVRKLLSGEQIAAESVQPATGLSFPREWREEASRKEQLGKAEEGRLDWDALDGATMDWWGKKLDAKKDSKRAVTEELLGGRSIGLTPDELRQLTILFGSRDAIRRVVKRDLVDLRSRSENSDERWVERIESDENVLQSLRAAIDFVSRHTLTESVGLEELSETTGTADYVAMREALVNLFIHQDYTDQSAAAQVDLEPKRATFFNTGYSLVGDESIVEGGKSQARNPLIARALKLIGFAEIAGTGIRSIQREWRRERRRPPTIRSDRDANTFSLALDWRQVKDAYDDVWKDRIGVELDGARAAVLNLAADGVAVTPTQAASAAGVAVEDARSILKYLKVQVLLSEEDGAYTLQPHLQKILEEESDPLLARYREYLNADNQLDAVDLDAIRNGFKRAFEKKNYEEIVSVAEKLDDDVLQSDEQVLMYFDVAKVRLDNG